MRIPYLRRAAAGQQYALIVGLIAVIAIAAITSVGGSVRALMTGVSNRLLNVNASQTTSTGGGGASNNGPSLAYLAVADTTLANTLNARLGAAAAWTLCYSAPNGTAFNGPSFFAGCGGASQLLNINVGGGQAYGGYIGAAWSSYSTGSWAYPAGFMFTTAGGRAANVYDHRCGTPGNGQVRVILNDGISFNWINMYISSATHVHYAANGEWGYDCNPDFNLRDGANATVHAGADLYFYRQ